jgi:hypothetical protein
MDLQDGSFNWRSRVLAPSARSNPTAFKAVRFQPPDPYENGEHDGVQAQRARGL